MNLLPLPDRGPLPMLTLTLTLGMLGLGGLHVAERVKGAAQSVGVGIRARHAESRGLSVQLLWPPLAVLKDEGDAPIISRGQNASGFSTERSPARFAAIIWNCLLRVIHVPLV